MSADHDGLAQQGEWMNSFGSITELVKRFEQLEKSPNEKPRLVLNQSPSWRARRELTGPVADQPGPLYVKTHSQKPLFHLALKSSDPQPEQEMTLAQALELYQQERQKAELVDLKWKQEIELRVELQQQFLQLQTKYTQERDNAEKLDDIANAQAADLSLEINRRIQLEQERDHWRDLARQNSKSEPFLISWNISMDEQRSPRNRSPREIPKDTNETRDFTPTPDGSPVATSQDPSQAGTPTDRSPRSQSQSETPNRSPRSQAGTPRKSPRSQSRTPSRSPRSQAETPSRSPRSQAEAPRSQAALEIPREVDGKPPQADDKSPKPVELNIIIVTKVDEPAAVEVPLAQSNHGTSPSELTIEEWQARYAHQLEMNQQLQKHILDLQQQLSKQPPQKPDEPTEESARKTETKRKRGSIKLVEAVTGGRSSDNMKKRDSSARKKKGTSGEKWNITGTPSPHLPSRSPPSQVWAWS